MGRKRVHTPISTKEDSNNRYRDQNKAALPRAKKNEQIQIRTF